MQIQVDKETNDILGWGTFGESPDPNVVVMDVPDEWIDVLQEPGIKQLSEDGQSIIVLPPPTTDALQEEREALKQRIRRLYQEADLLDDPGISAADRWRIVSRSLRLIARILLAEQEP